MKKTYYKVTYARAIRFGGGQIESTVCTFDEITETGNRLRAEGNKIFSCEIFLTI